MFDIELKIYTSMADLFIQGMTKIDLGDLVKQKLQEVLSEDTNLKENKPQQKRYLSRKETASLLNISLVTLSALTSAGKLKSYRINNKKILYKENEVEEALILINPLKSKK